VIKLEVFRNSRREGGVDFGAVLGSVIEISLKTEDGGSLPVGVGDGRQEFYLNR
jgi:hypothetical protein